jgi:hypothetical protein
MYLDNNVLFACHLQLTVAVTKINREKIHSFILQSDLIACSYMNGRVGEQNTHFL